MDRRHTLVQWSFILVLIGVCLLDIQENYLVRRAVEQYLVPTYRVSSLDRNFTREAVASWCTPTGNESEVRQTQPDLVVPTCDTVRFRWGDSSMTWIQYEGRKLPDRSCVPAVFQLPDRITVAYPLEGFGYAIREGPGEAFGACTMKFYSELAFKAPFLENDRRFR